MAMTADLFPLVAAFARVAHYGSFTKAAAELGLSPSALSQTIRTLEARLAVRLLDRSTRKVGLTEIGQRLLQQATPGLATLAGAIDSIGELRDKPAGLLRLNVSQTAADIVLMPYVRAFTDAYPDITLEIHCDNAMIDLVSDRFDAGIRLGENLAQNVVAAPLGGRQRIVTVAAPSYLASHALPKTPNDLKDHRCINVRLMDGIYRWEYSNRGRDFKVETAGPLLTNDGGIVLSAVRSGVGIACAFECQVEADIAAGTLLPLLKPWWPTFPGFYVYYSSRVHMPRKLRVFIDFMQQRLQVA